MNAKNLIDKEPNLQGILSRARTERRNNYSRRLGFYSSAKNEALTLVGYGARDECLRNHKAWEYFIFCLTEALRI